MTVTARLPVDVMIWVIEDCDHVESEIVEGPAPMEGEPDLPVTHILHTWTPHTADALDSLEYYLEYEAKADYQIAE